MTLPVIIPHKDNGKNDCRDLRMTLRSIERRMDVGEVVIVGDKPSWIKDVTFIPYANPYPSNKDANIIMATVKGALHMLNEHGYSGDVIVASDDCVLLDDYVPTLYYEESFQKFMENFPKRFKGNKWWDRPYYAMLYCLSLNLECDNCEAHVPQFLSVGSILMALEARIGELPLGAKTLFVNAERTFGNREAVQAREFKAHPEAIAQGKPLDGMRFCNWSPSSESEEFHEGLQLLFPTPSRYENGN